ncbi:MAG: helicase-related protein [Microthrixaceae bacterium]
MIVCPASLRTKWESEMTRRFDRSVRIFNSSQLLDLLDQVDKEGDERGFFVISSIETIRTLAVQEALQSVYPMIDLVVVDEAHIMRNTTTSAHSAGMLLGSLARALVFLSATPVNLRSDDLFHLLKILAPDEYQTKASFAQQVEPNRFVNSAAQMLRYVGASPRDVASELSRVHSTTLGDTVTSRWEYERVMELCATCDEFTPSVAAEVKRHLANLNSFSSVITRTRKVDVPQDKAVREPREIPVELTEAEAVFLKQVGVRIRAAALRKNTVPGFASQMPLRQAASCLPVMIDRVRRGDHEWELTEDEIAEAEDFGLIAGDGDDGETMKRQRRSASSGRTALEIKDKSGETPLIDLAERIGDTDSKFDAFLRYLRQAEEIGSSRVMVFSFFRGTLEYLKSRLEAEGVDARVIHGGVSMADRDATIDAFRADEFQILLSSEVGSEGLDFEFCNVIVNYDLPWNPMKVEQRIGRLDRFGQTNTKIFIFNFQIPGTIETEIFSRLYQRIRVFEESIGELEPILRDEVQELSKLALDPELSDSQRVQRANEIAAALEQRRLQLEELDSDTSLVNGAGNVLIEGFEDDPERGGRFVGPLELRELLERFSRSTGYLKVRRGSTESRSVLIGQPELATTIRRRKVQRSGSRYSTNELATMLDDEVPFEVTVSNEDASRTNTDLLSIRHPIVQAAADYFSEMQTPLWRFSSVRLPDAVAPDQRCLVALYLVETTGLRPRLEIWPFAATVESGAVVGGVGEAVLSAIAQRQLSDGAPTTPPSLDLASAALEQAMLQRYEQLLRTATRDNNAEVTRQIKIQRAKVAAERRTREETLQKPDLDLRVRRLHEGAIRTAQERLDETISELERLRQLTPSSAQLAYVLVDGRHDATTHTGVGR